MHFLPGKRAVMVVLAVAAVMLLPMAASALTFQLTVPNTDLSVPVLYPDPYVDVTVSLIDSTHAAITFTGDVTGGYYYLMGDGKTVALNVNAASFSVQNTVLDPIGVTESNPYTGFTPTLSTPPPPGAPFGSGNISEFGDFNFTITNFDGFTNAAQMVSFTLINNSGTWGSDNQVLLYNAEGYAAASHIFVWNGQYGTNDKPINALATGYVGNGEGGDIALPVPASALLLGSGLLGLALIGWRRREKKA